MHGLNPIGDFLLVDKNVVRRAGNFSVGLLDAAPESFFAKAVQGKFNGASIAFCYGLLVLQEQGGENYIFWSLECL